MAGGRERDPGGAGRGGALRGRTVVVTRPREQAPPLQRLLEGEGARVLLCPAVRVVPRPLDDDLAAVLARLDSYSLLVFTSVNGVRVFFTRLEEWRRRAGVAPSLPPGLRVAAIGPATAAALAGRGVACDAVPGEYVAEGLAAALAGRGLAGPGARVLLPRASEARSVLPETLRSLGAEVDVVPVYDTLPEEELAVPLAEVLAADYLTFTSGSTVRGFVRLAAAAAGGGPAALARRLGAVRVCSIGPVTSAVLREHGLPVAVEAREYTVPGLVAAIVADACGHVAPPGDSS